MYKNLLLLIVFSLSSFSLIAESGLKPWSEGVFTQIEKEHGKPASERMRDIYNFIVKNADKPLKDKIVLVNNKFNELPWVADKSKWSAEDYWATPFETITQFGGDCEDMAIGKFLALRLMGIPKNNLFLGYVKVKATNETHMILVWTNDDRTETLILDNMEKAVKSGKERTDLVAVYLTDAQGNIIILSDDGNQRSVKAEISDKKIKKLETVKKRMRENQEKYKAYNDGRPLLIL